MAPDESGMPEPPQPPQSRQPWWANHPDLEEMRRRTLEELECGARDPRPAVDEPDPVITEIMSGECRRGLHSARDDLDRARENYDGAIRAARTAGYSWGDIARILGVSKQSLHRRYR
ncbi:hypothetical protein O6P37_20080 [Mycobacterium sp. CPCC 205372]|uniref:Sigma-70 family RNA polymerase sigma factor n=1 Tax=Mycobacterium hippophais TaxID=3016340 RepID=A0ABT4PX69_9MYCO|nr:hypothetical protein [Mycobacterium hippophais]MCZ8381173.1 hypothetical protein [Mycobacterium hippophais]